MIRIITLNLNGIRSAARKGWLEAGDVFNTRTAAEVEEFFRRRRS